MIEEEGLGGKAQACRALGLARSAAYRLPCESVERRRLRKEIVALSRQHPRYGYRRITALLRRDQWSVNPKRVQRVRRQEGFQVSKRQRKMRRVGTSTALRQRANGPEFIAYAIGDWLQENKNRNDLHPAWFALGKRPHRKLPRQTARRMPQPGTLRQPAGSQSARRTMADRLQHQPASQLLAVPDPAGSGRPLADFAPGFALRYVCQSTKKHQQPDGTTLLKCPTSGVRSQ